jgi:UDP-glucose-4-epimerase GalE
MHFASLIAVGESMQDPAIYYDNNITGSLCLLAAARRHGVQRFVFSSTAAVYGIPEQSPIPEDAPKAPINPYGVTKRAIEYALEDYGRAYNLRWAALRYFNAAGADPDGEIGENHQPETHAIPLAIQAALGQRETFSLFGEDYPTPDGSAVRDYIHVTDLAEAHVAALRALLDDRTVGAMNLGVGRGLSVKEICAAVERATGKPLPLVRGPRRAGDPPMLVADATRARNELGWTPRLNDIDAIVGHAAAWFAKPLSERI